VKIVNAESLGYSKKAELALRDLGEVVMADADYHDLLHLIEEADILIVRLRHVIDETVLSRAKRLQVIVTATTGLNHIDLKAAEARGITVLSLKGEQHFLRDITATAELAWTLMLNLIRHLPEAAEHVNKGGWDRDSFKGNELKGKTLGILGFGRLGAMVAKYGHAFRMEVRAHDPYVESYPRHVTPCSLPDLLATSDILSIHIPLSEKTRGLVGKKEIAAMKTNTLLINTSRGEVLDEDSLAEALLDGRIGGIGVDVLADELSDSDRWLEESTLARLAKIRNDVIVTPHIGGATFESMENTELFMVNKLKNFLATTGVS